MADITEKTKFGMDLKLWIFFISLIVAGVAGWVTQKIEVNGLKERVTKLERQIEDSNLKVLEYKVDEIIKKIDKLAR